MENLHKGHRTRLRMDAEKKGIATMQEHQALELLLTYVIPQRDVNPLAHKLINKFGSFKHVLDASKTELMKVTGVGEKTAYFLTSLKEFFYLYKDETKHQKQYIKNADDAAAFVGQLLHNKLHEELYVVCIDGLNSVQKFEQISKGTSNATSVNLRKITEVVLASNTHNVIVCHNHPGGASNPSPADDKMTKALVMGLALNNIHLLDHIIIGSDGYYSYSLSKKIDLYLKDLQHMISDQSFMQNACPYNQTN